MSNIIKKGRFTDAEDKFIRDNHEKMTDKEISEALGRNQKSVTNRRTKIGLQTKRNKPKLTTKHRESYLASLDDNERKKFFEKEIMSSARLRHIMGSLDTGEIDYYIEKYIDFMMDPTVETMTAMEKDALHQMLVAEIRINRHMKDERRDREMVEAKNLERPPISRAKEIRECQEVILKCQTSLNVERRQRLKNQSDQSITFTNLIKEMKDPGIRHRMGLEATMLKVIREKFYNSHLGTNIKSGKDKGFDISRNFRDGKTPENISDEFLPRVKDE
jgi:hypothetical protein